ncbi:MAG TPA: alkaline phosphatase, partial [Corynebacterium sp.]|nr:alkaline phosphatase [Corynebacterium sp.]
GCYEQLYSYGSRSFAIFDTEGNQVFHSGADFEQRLAELMPDYFNSNHSASNFEGRSDDKGPEPEGVALGEINGRTYAFIGLERIGGVMVYDVTEPADSRYVAYVNNRDFSISMEDEEEAGNTDLALPQAGDLGPEGLFFIPAADSPNGNNLLAVGNEVSGTTTIFEIDGALTGPAEPGSSLPGELSSGSSGGRV